MQVQHWLMMAVVVIAGMFLQKYFDPLSKVGL